MLALYNADTCDRGSTTKDDASLIIHEMDAEMHRETDVFSQVLRLYSEQVLHYPLMARELDETASPSPTHVSWGWTGMETHE